MFSELFIWARIFLKPLLELCFALYDQTHLHVAAFRAYAMITLFIVIDYFRCFWVFYRAHLHHLLFLKRIGFLEDPDLVDSGRLVLFKGRDKMGFLEESELSKPASGFFNNASGNPAHLPISSTAIEHMWSALTKYTSLELTAFVDFGCGTGFALLSAMTKPLHAIVGVDLHRGSTILAKKNVTKFKKNSSEVKCSNVDIFDCDMVEFNDYPKTEGTTILYMYEPLWTVPKAEAHEIYLKVLEKAKKSCKRLLVAYFFAGRYDGNCLPALAAMKGRLLHQEKYISLFFETMPEDLYIYEIFNDDHKQYQQKYDQTSDLKGKPRKL